MYSSRYGSIPSAVRGANARACTQSAELAGACWQQELAGRCCCLLLLLHNERAIGGTNKIYRI